MADSKVIIEDLSDVFTKEGMSKLKRGQLLRFNYENSMNEFIITRLNKKSGIVMAKRVHTRRPEDTVIEDAYGVIESFNEYMEGKK